MEYGPKDMDMGEYRMLLKVVGARKLDEFSRDDATAMNLDEVSHKEVCHHSIHESNFQYDFPFRAEPFLVCRSPSLGWSSRSHSHAELESETHCRISSP